MLRNTRSSTALLIMSAFVLLATTRISLSTQRPQQPHRLIEQKFAPGEPVKITSVRNKRAKVKIGAKFQDDEAWLKGFTLELINTNNEAIQFVSIELLLPRPQGQREPPLATSLRYGQDASSPITSSGESKPISSGETVVLTLTDIDHANLRALLHTQKYGEPIDRIRLRLEEVLFVNGTKWIAGQFFRRDDQDPNRWVPIDDSVPKLNHPIRSRPSLQGGSIDSVGWLTLIKTRSLPTSKAK